MNPNRRDEGSPPNNDLSDLDKAERAHTEESHNFGLGSSSFHEPEYASVKPARGDFDEDAADDSLSDISSVFSERHMEGPPSVKRSPSTPLSRTASRNLQRTATVASTTVSRIRSRVPRAPLSHPLANEKTKPDVIVEFDGEDDPYRPLKWPFRKKAITTVLYGLTAMGATLASSIYSPAVDHVAHEFHIGQEVSILGVLLLLFVFGVGPLLWAPLSEVYGRKPAVLIPTFIAAIFAFGGGAAKDVQTIMLCRFFQGECDNSRHLVSDARS
jgi:hypothetical protein